jgi:hypothetical protein
MKLSTVSPLSMCYGGLDGKPRNAFHCMDLALTNYFTRLSLSQKTQAGPRSPDKDGMLVFECDGLGNSAMFFPPESLMCIQLVFLAQK